jgi:hypothetical protein
VHSKIAVGDLVIRIARHAAAECALRTDELFTDASDQHVTRSSLYTLSEGIDSSGGGTASGWLAARGTFAARFVA